MMILHIVEHAGRRKSSDSPASSSSLYTLPLRSGNAHSFGDTAMGARSYASAECVASVLETMAGVGGKWTCATDLRLNMHGERMRGLCASDDDPGVAAEDNGVEGGEGRAPRDLRIGRGIEAIDAVVAGKGVCGMDEVRLRCGGSTREAIYTIHCNGAQDQ